MQDGLLPLATFDPLDNFYCILWNQHFKGIKIVRFSGKNVSSKVQKDFLSSSIPPFTPLSITEPVISPLCFQVQAPVASATLTPASQCRTAYLPAPTAPMTGSQWKRSGLFLHAAHSLSICYRPHPLFSPSPFSIYSSPIYSNII